jgi:Family of unknown function (DUF5522)
VSEPLAHRPLTSPHPERLPPEAPAYAQIIEAHAGALRVGAISYVDPVSGLSVLTAGYLVARGTCCGSGCRHCPYVT